MSNSLITRQEAMDLFDVRMGKSIANHKLQPLIVSGKIKPIVSDKRVYFPYSLTSKGDVLLDNYLTYGVSTWGRASLTLRKVKYLLFTL